MSVLDSSAALNTEFLVIAAKPLAHNAWVSNALFGIFVLDFEQRLCSFCNADEHVYSERPNREYELNVKVGSAVYSLPLNVQRIKGKRLLFRRYHADIHKNKYTQVVHIENLIDAIYFVWV